MARYSRLYSNYVLRKKHMTTTKGVIYERDWVTLGERHMFEPGKRPIYYDGNFVFTDNSRINTKKRHRGGDFVASWLYDDVKDALPNSNVVKVNMRSNDMRDFAYYGSCRELVRVSALNIMNWFPGNIKSTDIVFSCEGQEQGVVLSNQFEIDLIHTLDEQTPYDNPMRYMRNSWGDYTLNRSAITAYSVENYDVVPVCPKEGKCYKVVDVTVGNAAGNTVVISGYYSGGGIVYVTEANNVLIQPKQDIIEDYFRNLDGFEKLMLNRESTPLYTNKLITPIEKPDIDGYVYVQRDYTWPSDDYCISVDSPAYYSYMNSLYTAAELFDREWCDNLYRNMTHEAIKNFDWTYTRDYAEGEEEDYVDGGEVMEDTLRVLGRLFDDIKREIDGIRMTNTVTYDRYNNVSDAELTDKLELAGWDVVSTIPDIAGVDGTTFSQSDTAIDDYAAYATVVDKEDIRRLSPVNGDEGDVVTEFKSALPKWYTATNNSHYTANEVDIEFMRQVLLSSKYMFSAKGTLDSVEMIMGMFGLGRGVDYEIMEGYKTITPKQWFTYGDNGYVSYAEANRIETGRLRFFDRPPLDWYDDPYEGLPFGELRYKNREYFIPMCRQGNMYFGNFGFQSEGGWGRHNNYLNSYMYTETLSYLRTADNIDELLALKPIDAENGMVFYVYNLVDMGQGADPYVSEDDYPVSHFYGLMDSDRPDLYSSWKNIVMDPDTEGFDETDELYKRAKYLDGIVSVNTGNNPHTGYGRYDMGSTYDQYMTNPFKYIVSNYDLDDDVMNQMMSDDYTFSMDRHGVLDTDSESGDTGNDLKIVSTNDHESDGVLEKYYINDKIMVIKNLHGADKTVYCEYFMNVVFPYLTQMIPSTTLLRLDGFRSEDVREPSQNGDITDENPGE